MTVTQVYSGLAQWAILRVFELISFTSLLRFVERTNLIGHCLLYLRSSRWSYIMTHTASTSVFALPPHFSQIVMFFSKYSIGCGVAFRPSHSHRFRSRLVVIGRGRFASVSDGFRHVFILCHCFHPRSWSGVCEYDYRHACAPSKRPCPVT